MASAGAYSTSGPKVSSTDSKYQTLNHSICPHYCQAREYAYAKDLLSRHGAKVVDVDITPPEQYMIGEITAEEAIGVVIG